MTEEQFSSVLRKTMRIWVLVCNRASRGKKKKGDNADISVHCGCLDVCPVAIPKRLSYLAEGHCNLL